MKVILLSVKSKFLLSMRFTILPSVNTVHLNMRNINSFQSILPKIMNTQNPPTSHILQRNLNPHSTSTNHFLQRNLNPQSTYTNHTHLRILNQNSNPSTMNTNPLQNSLLDRARQKLEKMITEFNDVIKYLKSYLTEII